MQRTADKALAPDSDMTDAQVVAAVRGGDSAAFRVLFERHRKRCFILAYGWVSNEPDALDVVQDAFVRAYQNLASFEGNSSFYTWMYRIVMNLAIDLMRKNKRVRLDDFAEGGISEGAIALAKHAVDEQPCGFDPGQAVDDKRIAARISAALAELSENHRTVLVLREVDGMSYEDMAQVMDCSKGTVMSRLFHARKKMQELLADLRPDGSADLTEGLTDNKDAGSHLAKIGTKSPTS